MVSLILGFGVGGVSVYLLFPDASRSAPTSTTEPLSPTHFTPATIIMNETCGPDTKLLELAVEPSLLPRESSNASLAPIWSVYIKDDDIQVERPYTPLKGVHEHGRMLFWIKKYSKGEVGRWLHSKHVGERVELRGPLQTWLWKEDTWDEVIMISGGTGITPFYQLFHTLISRHSFSLDKTRFTLLHSSRTPADLPPPTILEPLVKYAAEKPERFRLQLFVDSLDSSTSPLMPELKVGHINKTAIKNCLDLDGQYRSWWSKFFERHEPLQPPPRKTLFLVCGPDPMISAIAGPYGRNFSQGPLGGVLGEIGLISRQVWKL